MERANPSLKKGYLSVATELVEQFARCNIPGNEMRILWCVMRKTWGWTLGNRKKDWDIISYSQFEKMTGMKHRSVGKTLKSVVAKRLLLKGVNGYKINQCYNEWIVAKRLPVASKVTSSSKRGIKSVAKRLHTIDTTIDNIQKIRTPPTIDEVKAYCNERDNGVDANKWHDFYTGKGWMIGKNKMVDWKAAVRTWENGKSKKKERWECT